MLLWLESMKINSEEGMHNGVLLKWANHTLKVWSNNHNPWHWAKGCKDLSSYKIQLLNVYSSFIHNCQDVEAIRFPSGGKHIIVVHSDNGILFSSKHKITLERHEAILNVNYQAKSLIRYRCATNWRNTLPRDADIVTQMCLPGVSVIGQTAKKLVNAMMPPGDKTLWGL